MKNIICIMGKSSTGKSTLINNLVKKDKKFYGVKSFTTRKPRANDLINDLKTHSFVTLEKYNRDKNEDKIIALYHNIEKNYYNWTTEESFLDNKINLYAIDPKAYISFVEKYKKEYNIFGFYLNLNEKERIKRKIKRDGINDVIDLEHHLSLNILKENKEIKDLFLTLDINNLSEEEIINNVLNILGGNFE